jgi:nitrogen fixation protein NifU and related proteins
VSLLSDLYSEVILEHYKHPHNVGEMPDATVTEKGYNESCGDDIRLFVKLKDKIIEDVTFVGRGCAISQSSASMMTEALKGKTIDEALSLVEEFKLMITGEKQFPDEGIFEELAALKGVIKLPVRVKCASLSWNTLKLGLTKFRNDTTTSGSMIEGKETHDRDNHDKK